MYIRNLTEIIGQLETHLEDYLQENGIDTRGAFLCINPEHKDTHPSCSIQGNDKKTFHCMSCNSAGSIFKAVHFLEGKAYEGPRWMIETVPYLAEKYNVKVDATPPTEDEIYELNTYKAYARAAQYIVSSPVSEKVTQEIKRRGWSDKNLKSLGVGSVVSFKHYWDWMKEDFAATFLEEIDLKRNQIFNENSIIFTVRDEYGEPVGFASRDLDWNGDKSSPKYINQSTKMRCNIYQKGKRLFGMDYLVKNLRGSPQLVYIFEGYPDVVTAREHGIMSCVAIGGTSFTIDQLHLLKSNGFHNICLCLDGDLPGKKKIEGILDTILAGHKDVSTKIMILPDDKDPDDLIREKGKEGFLAVRKWAAFEWRLNQFEEETDGQIICDLMVPHIVTEPNFIQQETMCKTLAARTNVSIKTINQEVGRLQNARENQKVLAREAIIQRLQQKLSRDPGNAEIAITEASSNFMDLMRQYSEDHLSEQSTIALIDQQKKVQEEKEAKFAGMILGQDLKEMAEALNGEWQDNFMLFAGKANTGKCLAEGSLVLMGNGDYKKIEDVVRDRDNEIITKTLTNKLIRGEVIDWIKSGELECISLKTKDGIETSSSLTHPFFTLSGWKPANELKVGDKIATSSNYNVFSDLHSLIDSNTAILLGYLIGDGSITEHVGLSNISSEIIERFELICKLIDPNIYIRYDANATVSVSYKKGRLNPIEYFLEQFDIIGKNAHEKKIPKEIFKSSLKTIAKFLGALYATDGWISPKEIGISFCNKFLLQQVRSLLLRFGIKGRIYESTSSYEREGKRFPRFTLTIKDSESWCKFYNNIEILFLEKQEKLKQLLESTSHIQGCYNNNFPGELWSYIIPKAKSLGISKTHLMKLISPTVRSIYFDKSTNRYRPIGRYDFHINGGIQPIVLESIGRILNDEFLINIATGDICFDEIIETELIGKKSCFDLTVKDFHNFIVQDTVVHNSALFSKLAYEIATHKEENNAMVIYLTIDDSFEQTLPRLVCIASGSKQLELNEVTNPNYFSTKSDKSIPMYREKGYSIIRDLTSRGRLILKDANHGRSLAFVESLIKYYREKYPKRKIVFLLDNFHKLQDLAGAEIDRGLYKAMSQNAKNIATRYHIPLLATCQYTKITAGERATNEKLSETVQLEFDANLIIHLYSEMSEISDRAKDYHEETMNGKLIRLPRLEANFGKNKISDYRGRIYLDFWPACSDFKEVDYEIAIKEREERSFKDKKKDLNQVLV
jgi:replicative DNA helicase